MHLVWIIALLTAIGSHKGLYTGPDGKVLTFETKDACESAITSIKLDQINVLGKHGQCERHFADAAGRIGPRYQRPLHSRG